MSGERADFSFRVYCRGSRDLRNTENFYRATRRYVAENSAVLGHHPNSFRFQLFLLQSMPIFYFICNVVFQLWFLFLYISRNRLVGIVNIEFCHIEKSEITSLHLSRYQILECRKVPNIGSFTYKCCKKSHWILPKKTAFNSSVILCWYPGLDEISFLYSSFHFREQKKIQLAWGQVNNVGGLSPPIRNSPESVSLWLQNEFIHEALWNKLRALSSSFLHPL